MLHFNSADSTPLSERFLVERQSLLEATNDGLDVFAHFGSYFGCEGYPRLDHNYVSPFPLNKKYRKSFRLSYGEGGQIKFNDFAAQQMGDCFSFVKVLLGYSFSQAVNYIKQTIVPGWQAPVNVTGLLLRTGRPRLVEKPLLSITPWMRAGVGDEPVDRQRYDLVGITPQIRQDYHCYYLGGADIGNRFNEAGEPADPYIITHSAANPLYGYWYPTTDKWKLTRPLHPNKDFRWGPNNVRGTDQPMFGEHLLPDPKLGKQPLGILAPGQRDTMAAAALMGCWVGALSSESAHLHADQFGLLSACFERLAFFTDNDEAGDKGGARLAQHWGLRSLNSIIHSLGENDLCAWLKEPAGQRADLRAQVGRDLWRVALA